MPDILSRIRLRRGTAAQWASANPVLAAGEPGFETDTNILRVGDGVTSYTSLRQYPSIAAGGAINILTAPAYTGQAGRYARVAGAETGMEFRTAQQLRETDLSISGPGGTISATITNLDTQNTGGVFYAAAGATGLPVAEASIVEHLPGNATTASVQRATSLASQRTWWRREVAGVWQSWVEVNAGLTIASFAAAAIRLASEGLTSPLDTELATAAWAKAYADAAVAAAGPPAPTEDMVLLGTLATTSGSTVTLSGLDLTAYSRLMIEIDGVSVSGTTQELRLGAGTTRPISGTLSSAAGVWKGQYIVNLLTGIISGCCADVGGGTGTFSALSFAGASGLSQASTSVSFTISTGAFDAGNIRIYGIV